MAVVVAKLKVYNKKMNIETTKKIWSIGELAALDWNAMLLKTCGRKFYSYYHFSQYVCIREATKGQRGILVKGLGRISRKHVMLLCGKPFCKDEREDLFAGRHYYGYPLPTVDELKEVLDIVSDNTDIQQKLIDNGMFFYPEGTFWVSNTKTLLLGLQRKLQYYSPSTGSLTTANSQAERHQRITIAYF
ncbi:MAG: hypothetical protein IJ637_08060 [Prevotella sp.]|nr:hypothetical protein [Prevotella sp.]